MPPSGWKRCASVAGPAKCWKKPAFVSAIGAKPAAAWNTTSATCTAIGTWWIQAYEVRSVTHDEKLVYASDFTLYLAGSAVPADFSYYSKADKQWLWAVIFDIKPKFFAEVLYYSPKTGQFSGAC